MVLPALLLGEQPLHDPEDRPRGHPRDGDRGERGTEILDDQVRPVAEEGPGEQGEVGQSLGEVTAGQAGDADVDIAHAVLSRARLSRKRAHTTMMSNESDSLPIDLVGAHRSAPGAGPPRVFVPEMEDPGLRSDFVPSAADGDIEQAAEAEEDPADHGPQRPQQEVASQEEQRRQATVIITPGPG